MIPLIATCSGPLAYAEALPVQRPTANAEQTRPIEMAAVEQDLVDVINRVRAHHGLPALSIDTRLTAAAISHSIDMAGNRFFAHQGSDGSESWDRATQEGYRWIYIAENIGCGQGTPERLVETWLDSPPHRANVLAAQVTDVGVALATRKDSECQLFWTAVFAAQR